MKIIELPHIKSTTIPYVQGNDANIGVICRNAGYYHILSEVLTGESVREYFAHYFNGEDVGEVVRFDLPGIYAFNFLLKDVLGM